MISVVPHRGSRAQLDRLERLPVYGMIPGAWAACECKIQVPPDVEPAVAQLTVWASGGGVRIELGPGHSGVPGAGARTLEATLTPCRYGGHRAWWVCGGCQRRSGVLYEHNGCWRCRRCVHGGYRSLVASRFANGLARLRRLHLAAGGSGGLRDPLERPKGMHRNRYEATASPDQSSRAQSPATAAPWPWADPSIGRGQYRAPNPPGAAAPEPVCTETSQTSGDPQLTP